MGIALSAKGTFFIVRASIVFCPRVLTLSPAPHRNYRGEAGPLPGIEEVRPR